MGSGNKGLYSGTMNTTYLSGGGSEHDTYSDRGIAIPEHLQQYLSKLAAKNDYIIGTDGDFSMTDASILSRETGVEFARITIGDQTFLIRGDKNGATIPESLMRRLVSQSGTLDFHSHPHDGDLIPSRSDRMVMSQLEKATGQRTSKIVTPNGLTTVFDKHGVIETGIVSNKIDDSRRKALLELFGGK